MEDGRANYMAEADYGEDSRMEKLMQKIIDLMQADDLLEEYEGVIQ